MVTYPLNELQPGMIVAADVFTPRGQLIVLRGSILSQQMIQHMKYYHVPSVTILPNEIDPMSARANLSKNSGSIIRRVPAFFRNS